MTENTSAAEPGRDTAAPVATLYETAVNPTLAINPTTTTQGLNTMINNTKDFIAFGKANVEAITASGKIWAAGVQDLTKQFAGTALTSYDESLALANALSAAKSVKEAINLQNTHVVASIAKAVARSKSMADASVKLTEQAMAPLRARVDVAVGSLKKAA
jgi:phasin family protein